MRSQTTPLPFAKPSIDAATIAAVGSVLASGWITSGPKVLEFEARPSQHRSQGWRDGMLPHAERVGRGILTLPLFPAMTEADVERVCARLAEACRSLLS